VAFLKIDNTRPRLAEEVYEQLFDAIARGALKPDDRLIQERLADEFGVSRTPVREALLRLEQERIIEQVGRGGFVVRTMSSTEIRDIYGAREAIEGYAARLVAERGDPAPWEEIRRAVLEQTPHAHGPLREAYLANRTVHRAVVEATGNAHLLELFDAVWGRAVSLLLYADLHRVAEGHFERAHADLLDALRSGDADKACDAMVAHIRDGLAEQLGAHAEHTAR